MVRPFSRHVILAGIDVSVMHKKSAKKGEIIPDIFILIFNPNIRGQHAERVSSEVARFISLKSSLRRIEIP